MARLIVEAFSEDTIAAPGNRQPNYIIVSVTGSDGTPVAGLGASSVDHLDYISERGMDLMGEKKTIGVLLPGVPFHLMTDRYAPARKLIKAGVPVALVTDFNPGSCPTLSMQMVIALACRQLKMTPAEAINAATINAAYALDRGDRIGSIEVGKKADIIVLDIPNHQQLPYWFGVNLVAEVVKNGVTTYPP